MSERTKYVHGTPSWIDLGSPDPEASVAFYGGLFGWEAGEPNAEAGGYRRLLLGGKAVGGLMQAQDGQPPAWSTYIAVDDIDAAMQRAATSGGTSIVEATDVMDLGRMSFVADPTGAVVGMWQDKGFAGSELANEPGAFGWNELATRDSAAAQAFYAAAFGWTYHDAPMGDVQYTLISADGNEAAGGGGPGDAVGGIVEMNDEWPAEMPAHWMVYFHVEDIDVSVAKAKELGGTIHVGPQDLPVGRFAVIADPQGAVFTVIRPADVQPPGF